MHEEKGVINLTYKAIVSFTRIAANVHTECPTNVEALQPSERNVNCDSEHFASPLPSAPVSVGGYESGRDPSLLLTSLRVLQSIKPQRATLCMTSRRPHDQRF